MLKSQRLKLCLIRASSLLMEGSTVWSNLSYLLKLSLEYTKKDRDVADLTSLNSQLKSAKIEITKIKSTMEIQGNKMASVREKTSAFPQEIGISCNG